MPKKIKVTLYIDSEIKRKALYIIQNILHSSLSHEVEIYLEKITEGAKIERK